MSNTVLRKKKEVRERKISSMHQECIDSSRTLDTYLIFEVCLPTTSFEKKCNGSCIAIGFQKTNMIGLSHTYTMYLYIAKIVGYVNNPIQIVSAQLSIVLLIISQFYL